MTSNPWPRRIVLAFVAFALYVGAAASWWLPRGFPG